MVLGGPGGERVPERLRGRLFAPLLRKKAVTDLIFLFVGGGEPSKYLPVAGLAFLPLAYMFVVCPVGLLEFLDSSWWPTATFSACLVNTQEISLCKWF